MLDRIPTFYWEDESASPAHLRRASVCSPICVLLCNAFGYRMVFGICIDMACPDRRCLYTSSRRSKPVVHLKVGR